MFNSWEEITVGAQTGSVDFVVTEAMVDEHLAAVELDGKWLEEPSDGGKRVIPSDLLPKLSMKALFTDYMLTNVGPNMRVKQTFKFFSPVYSGTRILATGRISDKYEKSAKRYVALEAMFTDTEGTPLMLDQRVVTVLGENFKMKD